MQPLLPEHKQQQHRNQSINMEQSKSFAAETSSKPLANTHSSCTTPEPDFPHETHDLNKLEAYFLETTAFGGQNTMGSADGLRRSGKDIKHCYSAIAESHKNPPLLLATRATLIDNSSLNYDRIGILFEYRNTFHVALEGPAGKDATATSGIQKGFLHRSRVGMPLVAEWESLPKRRISYDCFGATGSTRGWWHVHSMKIMKLREGLAVEATRLCNARDTMKKNVSVDEFTKELTVQFGRIVEAFYGIIEVAEKQALKEVTSAWDEFMVDDI